jgi:2-phospho-L-lactate/phosphoenolpyruvate guanylyltransferase
MRTAAVLPVKRFSHAKQRLGASVADTLRERLARAMVADVMLALSQAASIERTIVVTREGSTAAAAAEHGAIVVPDEAESGQSAAATLGLRRALAEGFERALCVPGDCPALDPAELDALLDAHARGALAGVEPCPVVIVPDRHGSGTNGLLLAPPDAIAPAFGADSCKRHRRLALAAGLACHIERPASLALDVDTGADLAALRERLSGHAGARAPHTRALLGARERCDALPVSSPA